MAGRTRRRARGKNVTMTEFGFSVCQIITIVLLLGVLSLYTVARMEFEPGEEYLPVTIIYTESEERIETYMEDGKQRTRTLYDNSYYYVVDGVRYDGQVHDAYYGVTQGEQATRYYNPNDPNEVSEWQSIRDMMGQTTGVVVAAVIFQGLAVFLWIMTRRQKRRFLQSDKDYEEGIRQDMQKNREIYQSLEMSIDKEKLFSELEPLRRRIHKNQNAIEKIEERAAASVGGLFLIFHLIIKAIDALRLRGLQNQLDEDSNLFYREYKRNIAEPLLSRLLEEVQYRPSQGFSMNELEESKLITVKLSTVESEDYIEGVYKGIRYRQADVKKEKDVRDSELLNMTEGLRGRISVYDFNKSIQGEIIIRTKNTSAYIGGMEKIVMENLQFNERFEVYATNSHMVFYLLTPPFMEYLLRLKLWGNTVFRFADNKIFVLRNQVSGIFEPDMGRTLDIAYEIGKSYNELKEVLDFIDILKLGQAEEAGTGAIRFRANQSVTAEQPMEADQLVEAEKSIKAGRLLEAEDSTDGVSQGKSSSGFRLKLE